MLPWTLLFSAGLRVDDEAPAFVVSLIDERGVGTGGPE